MLIDVLVYYIASVIIEVCIRLKFKNTNNNNVGGILLGYILILSSPVSHDTTTKRF